MPALTRYQVPSVLLILLGLGVVVSLLVLFPHAGQQEYHHSVSSMDEAEVPEAANVAAYEELSPRAQDAFRAALESDDGHHIVHGEANAPPEWHYSDHSSINEGYYVITYDGRYYELATWAGSFEAMFGFAVALVGLFGLALAAVGGSALRRDRPRSPATILATSVSVVALGFVWRHAPPAMQDHVAVVGAGVVAAIAGGTWLLLGRLWRSP